MNSTTVYEINYTTRNAFRENELEPGNIYSCKPWIVMLQVETSHTSKGLGSLTISVGIGAVITAIIHLKIILIIMKET